MIKVDESFETLEINGKLFVKALPSDKLYEKKGALVQFPEDEDLQIALIRYNGRPHCLDNICPHEHQPKIFEGVIQNGAIICPEHAWTYDIETGMNLNARQGRKNLRKYDVFERDGWIYVEKPELRIPKWRAPDNDEA